MSRKYNKSQAWFGFQANRPKTKAERELYSYQQYTTQFSTRVAKLQKRGYEPNAPYVLSFEEFKKNRLQIAKMGVAPGNITRTIVSRQLYQFNRAQAEDMMAALKELDIINDKDKTIYGTKVTIDALRSKGGLGEEALSLINDKLKEQGKSGYERRDWITEHIYQDSI